MIEQIAAETSQSDKVGAAFSKLLSLEWQSKESGRIVVSLLLTACLFLILWVAVPLTYQVGDDAYYRSIVAGYVTGVPDAHTVFMGYAVSELMSGLFRIAPSIPWYDIISYSILLLSTVAIIKSLFKATHRNGVSQSCSLLIGLLSLIGLLAYPIAVVNFSTTSAIAGAASVAVISELLKSKDDGRITVFADGLLFLFLAVLSFEWRVLMFELSCCFIVVVAVCRIVWGDKRVKKAVIGLLGALVIALIPLIMVDTQAYDSTEWKNYISYNTARAHYMDYSHPSWDSAKDEYAAEGWTENLIKLVENRFLMDEDINEDSLRALASEHSSISEAVDFLLSFIKSRPVVQGYIVAGILLAVLVGLSWMRRWREPNSPIETSSVEAVVITALICLGALGAIGYCSLRGNLFFRHFVGLMLFPFPAMIKEASALFSNSELGFRSQETKELLVGVLGRTALICSLCIPAILSLLIITDGTRQAIIQSRRNTYEVLTEYTSNHPESIFIGSIYPDFSMFKTQDINLESNYFFWGHFQSMMYSPLYTDKLNRLGKTEWLYSSALLDDDVYYVGENNELAQLLLAYLEEETGHDLEWGLVASLPVESVVLRGSQYIEETYNPNSHFLPVEHAEKNILVLKIRLSDES